MVDLLVPKIYGPHFLPKCSGYNPSINPQITISFSTAAYRFGHSGVSNQLLWINKTNHEIVELSNVFSNPNLLLQKDSVDSFLRLILHYHLSSKNTHNNV